MAALPVWLEGACICLFGSTLTALGLVVQKFSHTVNFGDMEKPGGHVAGELGEDGKGDAAQASQSSAYYLQKWWIVGFLLYACAQVINMVSMAMTPQVILSCLGSWTLVCNTVFAHLLLGEQVCRKQMLAVVALVVSTAFVIYTAPRPSPEEEAEKPTLDDLTARFSSPDFGGLTAAAIVVAVSARLVASRRIGEVPMTSVETAEEERRLQAVVPIAWSVVAAIAAGYTALLFKCIAELIAGYNTALDELLWRWQTYVLLAVAVTVAPSELHCLNMALQTGDAVFVVPMYLAMGMLSQLTTGGVFFREFQDFHSMHDACLFFASVTFALGSVVFMALAQADPVVEAMDQNAVSVTTPPATIRHVLSESLLEHEAAEDVPDGYFTPPGRRSRPKSTAVQTTGFAGAIEGLEKMRAKTYYRLNGSMMSPYRYGNGSKLRSYGPPVADWKFLTM